MKFSSIIFALVLVGCSETGEPLISPVAPDKPALEWIGTQIFQNECAQRKACLVHWNEGEAFPSLGIGHFIWYPAGQDGPFVESFPQMVEYLVAQGESLPGWLDELEPLDAPWPSREAFLAVSQSAKVSELRDFLASTKGAQAGFLVRRANEALNRVVRAAPEPRRAEVIARINALQATPGGVYALIDYVNFKGEGLSASEQYQGQGWGLLHVLLAMDDAPADSALSAFRLAAGEVLSRRADNAEKAIERERWLPGWLNRLDTYREIPSS